MNREYDERHSSNPSPSYKTKGRGHGRDGSLNENISVSVESPIQSNMEYPYNSRLCNVGVYESIGESGSFRGTGPQRSVNGWALFVTNIHEEAQEDGKNGYIEIKFKSMYLKLYFHLIYGVV